MNSRQDATSTTATRHYPGQLLSETDSGVDYLESSIYASAIAESIHEAKTSITVGIYAKWGSGKSFLLKHIENLLRRLQNQDELDKVQTPRANYKCQKSNRLLCWTFALLLTILLFVVTVIMAAKPDIFFPLNNSRNSNISLTTASPRTEEQRRTDLLRSLQIAGCILIPVELLVVFGLASFGLSSSGGSRKFEKIRILFYALFTRIPMQKTDDPDPDFLRNSKPGDEILALAATPDIRFPRRYVFVNFKAWEYAGSDTLWAAIVTNISDAIEAEFGVVTSRLFRTLSVSEVSEKRVSNPNRTLYIRFKPNTDPIEIRRVMTRYGVVTSLRRVDEAPDWLEIAFSTNAEMRNAADSLAVEGVATSTKLPSSVNHDDMVDGQSPLVRDVEDAGFEMTSPSESYCCSRFCSHFSRHPVTFCRLPKLFWWILLAFASLLIPVTAYVVASVLSIRTAQTWWAVPPYAQVLLWLPGPLSVVVFACKFAWALCHSQTRRIHEALDGIQGKMASQLGFMSVVKQEVAVMTKLIRCARFVLQKDYRVIIAVDDLDRIEMKKVHSVLEAVGILLSDKSSPFFCLVAADPRIVVKCVEENLGSVLKNAQVSGREYLKKIINLPVCLPECNEPIKKRFIAGLIDQSDGTFTYARQHARNVSVAGGASDQDQVDGICKDIGRGNFLFACRRFLYEDEDLRRHIHGNARTMKRIFNVISMTSCLINTIVKKQEQLQFLRSNVNGDQLDKSPAVEGFPKIVRSVELAKKLVHWIVLVDEWPYRTSFIVQVVLDADQREVAGLVDTRIPNDTTIAEIYRDRVERRVQDSNETLSTLDGDPDLFQTYLLLLGNRGFTKLDILYLLRLTINLDNSIRRRIALQLTPPPMPTENLPIADERRDEVTTIVREGARRKISLKSFSHFMNGESLDDDCDEAETTC